MEMRCSVCGMGNVINVKEKSESTPENYKSKIRGSNLVKVEPGIYRHQNQEICKAVNSKFENLENKNA